MSNQFEIPLGYVSPVKNEIKKEIGDWAEYLAVDTIQKTYSLLNYLNKFGDFEYYFPRRDEVFRIYNDLSLENIKVVILGKQPYNNYNNNGYAFGCKYEYDKNLFHIFKSIMKAYPNKQISDASKDLEYLVKQGVFLLNTKLTIQKDSPKKNIGWKSLVSNTVELINNNNDFVVWMLWGRDVQYYEKFIDNPTHLVLKDVHPSYAIICETSWECNHFKECNDYLKSVNLKEIKWR